MKLIQCIIRPDKVEDVIEVLRLLDTPGFTVTEVRGHGKQKGRAAIYRGQEYRVGLLSKVMIQVVASDSVVDEVRDAIMRAAHTGQIGDGRIFVMPVDEAYNIRTGERHVI